MFSQNHTNRNSSFTVQYTERYRYGFNGMEKDDEVKGKGSSYDFGARMYDPRIGRFLFVDPLCKSLPNISTYSFALNSPNKYIDENGYKFADRKSPDFKKFKALLKSSDEGKALFKAMRKDERVYHFHYVPGTPQLSFLNPDDITQDTRTDAQKLNDYAMNRSTFMGFIMSKNEHNAVMSGDYDFKNKTFSTYNKEGDYTYLSSEGNSVRNASAWAETHIVFNENTIDNGVGAFQLSVLSSNGEKISKEGAKSFLMNITAYEESFHIQSQAKFDFNKVEFDQSSGKYIKGDLKDYSERNFENEAHLKALEHANQSAGRTTDDKKISKVPGLVD